MRFPYVDFDPESLKPVEPSTDADLSSPNSASSIVTSSGAKYKLFAITVCFTRLHDYSPKLRWKLEMKILSETNSAHNKRSSSHAHSDTKSATRWTE